MTDFGTLDHLMQQIEADLQLVRRFIAAAESGVDQEGYMADIKDQLDLVHERTQILLQELGKQKEVPIPMAPTN
jgi:hypothetical protein